MANEHEVLDIYNRARCLLVDGMWYEKFTPEAQEAWVARSPKEAGMTQAPKYRFVDDLSSDDYDYVDSREREKELDRAFAKRGID